MTSRYAYTIYDEGGLLDMNVAGYPTIMGDGCFGEFTSARQGFSGAG